MFSHFLHYIDIDRLIHSFKTALACIIGFFIARLIGFPSDQWIVISLIVVMCAQLHVGSVLNRAYMRFLGTLIGCLLATITLISFGHPTPEFALALTIAFSCFIFSYVATGQESLTYAGTLGAATTAIVLMSPNPTVATAGARFVEISIGILIATFISQFVLPIHARTYLRHTQAYTLQQLKNFYQIIIVDHKEIESMSAQELDESIAKLLSKQRILAKEAAREPFGKAFDPQQFFESLQCEKQILRAISLMHYALLKDKTTKEILIKLPALQLFNEAILQSYSVLIKALAADYTSKEQTTIPSLQTLSDSIRQNKALFSTEEITHVNGFLLAAEILISSLGKLAKLYQVLV